MSTAYLIESNIPIPCPTCGCSQIIEPRWPARNEQACGYRWPWQSLGVGDSFVETDPESFRSCEASGRYHQRRYRVKFVTRTLVEGGQRVLRVWRVE